MTHLFCRSCRLLLRTVGEPGEVEALLISGNEWYPDKYPCPSNGCDGLMTMTASIDSQALNILNLHDLTPSECYQALFGLGLPKERTCGQEEVKAALEGRTIVAVRTQPIHNDRRSVLTQLLLDSGVRVYLGSGPQGAIVYRIAQPSSLVKEVLDEQG